MANDPQYLIVHTAAFEGAASIEDIERWHRRRGFRMVGYHYYIRRDGAVQSGRQEGAVGAHCIHQGMNRKSLGICLEGHHDIEDWTRPQRRAFHTLAQELMARYDIDPERVLGHRETGAPKTCPGTQIDMDMERWALELAGHPRPAEPLPPEPA